MKAGWLRHTISIQSATRTVDAGGGVTEAWTTVTNGSRRAAIWPVSSNEQFAASQLQEKITHKVMIRWLSGVTTGMRVLFGTRAFDIRSVIDPREKNAEMILMCEERKAA